MAFLLDNILLAPCRAVAWIGQKLYDRAEEEVTDESAIHERLLALQTRLELGEIGDEEYIEREDALMGRLNEIHKYKESRREA